LYTLRDMICKLQMQCIKLHRLKDRTQPVRVLVDLQNVHGVLLNIPPRRQENKAISSLLINGVECKDNKTMENTVFAFYNNLYASAYSQLDSSKFLNEIKDFRLYPKLMFRLNIFVSLI